MSSVANKTPTKARIPHYYPEGSSGNYITMPLHRLRGLKAIAARVRYERLHGRDDISQYLFGETCLICPV